MTRSAPVDSQSVHDELSRRVAWQSNSVRRALAILELLHNSPRALSLSEISRVLALPKSTASLLLATLESVGYLKYLGAECREQVAAIRSELQGDILAAGTKARELACARTRLTLRTKLVFIADSKTPTGVAEVRLTDIAVEAFRSQIELAGPGPWLFPSPKSPTGYQREFKKACERTLRKADIPYFRLYDLRSTRATRLSAGGVANEWVTQMLRQTDAKVFKKYSQMKVQTKREARTKLNRKANELESGRVSIRS